VNPPAKKLNGTISERTKIPLSLGIPLVVFLTGCAGWVASVEERFGDVREHYVDAAKLLSERQIGDRFRGADMDRWIERIQWAWTEFSPGRYPAVPPWREGTHYIPHTLSK
jgi:hypothetical protein